MTLTGLSFKAPTAIQGALSQDPQVAASRWLDILAWYAPIKDQSQLHDSLLEQFTSLSALGDGQLYVAFPSSISFDSLVRIADSLRPDGVESTIIVDEMWTPGTDENSPTKAELDGIAAGFEARIALYNSHPDRETDPLLHFTEPLYSTYAPYDGYYRGRGRPTQLQQLAKKQTQFARQHAGYELRALDHRDFLSLVIEDRYAGSNRLAMSGWGLLEIPAIGRRVVGGEPYIAVVGSDHRGGLTFGQFTDEFPLSEEYLLQGAPPWDNGIGLSAGIEGLTLA